MTAILFFLLFAGIGLIWLLSLKSLLNCQKMKLRIKHLVSQLRTEGSEESKARAVKEMVKILRENE